MLRESLSKCNQAERKVTHELSPAFTPAELYVAAMVARRAPILEDCGIAKWLKVALHRPNLFTSARALLQRTALDLIRTGNAYWYTVKSDEPEIWSLPASYIRAKPDVKTFLSGWEYNCGDVTETFDVSEVCSFINAAPSSQYYGVPYPVCVDLQPDCLPTLDDGFAAPLFEMICSGLVLFSSKV